MTDLSQCKACVFDAYGTLFDVHSATARESAALGAVAEPLSNLWRQKQLEYTWLRSLMGAYVDFWQVTQDGLDFALESHGIDDPALRQRLLDLYWTLDAYPDAVTALNRLRAAGKGTAILTNGGPEMIEAACKASGVAEALDHLLTVAPLSIFKPHGSVYQLAVDTLGLPVGEICFVSTNAWDARGAASYGFRVVWLNRFAKIPDRLPGDFSAVIEDLDGLPPLLGI
ncbi:MAG: haloacid dehalogenase type II [Pseudomonadota bacterium]